MERRTLIAVILSFAVLYIYQAFFVPAPVKPPATQITQSTAATPSTPAAAGSTSATVVQPAPPPVEAVISSPAEQDITVDTKTIKAVFTNRGGRLKHWFLRGYQDERGQPVDLVPSQIPADLPLPFSLRVEDGTTTQTLNTALYRISGATGTTIDATQAPVSLVFEYQDVAGLNARKEFTLEPQSFVVTFSASVTQGDRALNPFVQWGPGLGDGGATAGGGSFFTGNYVQAPEAIVHNGDKVQRVAAANVAGQAVHQGNLRFAGVDDHYFIASLINPGQVSVEYRAFTLPAPGDETRQRQLVAHTSRFPQPPNGLKYYIGPKLFDELKSVDAEFVRAINFGIFAWLAVPFLSVLKWIYGYVGNYGWAIIFLTILMNIVIFPLRHKSVVSMRKMQQLQPQLKVIQDHYKDLKVTDPARQKMNTEMMNLYREKGVNPASGCIPMLLTFPVLFAFYALLSQAIELRGAPFGLWIHDLSQHDPYYVTPLLMGATMFWQQRITPTSADPTQQQVMMLMPVIFIAMFLRFPSGLAIYYFVNNLWAIGQQYFTNWLLGPMNVHTPRPPAERRMKSVGTGRTEGAEKKA